jgi:hypothetical protein
LPARMDPRVPAVRFAPAAPQDDEGIEVPAIRHWRFAMMVVCIRHPIASRSEANCATKGSMPYRRRSAPTGENSDNRPRTSNHRAPADRFGTFPLSREARHRAWSLKGEAARVSSFGVHMRWSRHGWEIDNSAHEAIVLAVSRRHRSASRRRTLASRLSSAGCRRRLAAAASACYDYEKHD